MGLAGDVCLIVVWAWLAGILCQALRLPLVLGYMGAGLCLSPHTWGPMVSDLHTLEMLADVGVALLLFTVGLEFPLPRLSQVGKVALIGTPLQVVGTILWGLLLGRCWGWAWLDGLWLGALLSLSSTVVVLRCLAQRGYLNSLAAQVMIGMLVVQDLCSVPILLILPKLGQPADSSGSLPATLAIGVMFVTTWLALGRWLLPWLFGRIASLRCRELFSLTVLAFGLGTGALAHHLGLSLAFGAFLAGLVLAESDYAHQAMHDVSPLRDLFTLLFFASVGMLIDPAWVWQNVSLIAPLLLLAWAGKGLLLAFLVTRFGYTRVIPFAVALSMGQMGELAFVIARLGQQSQALSPLLYKTLITLAALSMALTPLVAGWTEPIYAVWNRLRPPGEISPQDRQQDPVPAGAVVVVGYGRVGQIVTAALAGQAVPLLVLEIDPRSAALARSHGHAVVYGESYAPAVLEALGLEQCPFVVFTHRDGAAVEQTLPLLRELAPQLPILVRAGQRAQVERWLKLGVNQVVWPELEGALEMVEHCFGYLGTAPEVQQQWRQQLRAAQLQA